MDPGLTQIVPGQNVTLRYGGFVPRERVSLYVASTPILLSDGFADANGWVEISGVIPSDLSAGAHSLVLLSESGIGYRQSVSLESGGLPTTGSDFVPLALWSFTFVVLGLALTVLARRRRIS